MKYTGLTFVRATLGALLLALMMVAASPAMAQREWTVHSFRFPGVQGNAPQGTLVADRAGNLYGIAAGGGLFNNGIVYELVRPVPPKTGWTQNVLFNFPGDAGGAWPAGGLVFDSVGNLFGMTFFGGLIQGSGDTCCGVVFELSPPATNGGAWTESVLHVFGGVANGDGATPRELLGDENGNLYGVTAQGSVDSNSGCGDGCGTVFQLSSPASPGGVWTETILHSFVYPQASPVGRPVLDSQGNLYGMAEMGGRFDKGLVYRLLRPPTVGETWTYGVLHAFGAESINSPDGTEPVAGLSLRGKRILYGITFGGGLYNFGTVFQLVPPEVAGAPWTENVLYSFQGGESDGSNPDGNVIFDSAGNLYGTTFSGGSANGGTAFKLTPPLSDGPWTETILHSFSGKGALNPTGGVIFGQNGVLFGPSGGGTGNAGAVFGLLP
jgi:uncharacterized repeat protein (TIGR03803 family)